MKHDQSPSRYRGRFAPSPTGHLHFGSLVAAVASYLAARQAGGEWLVRIEDLDQPRVVPGSKDSIFRTLDDFGFEWTGSIALQSERTDLYQTALERLKDAGRVFPCSCSRKQIAAAGQDGDEPRYPGWCRNGPLHPGVPVAIRLRTDPGEIAFNDEIQGHVSIDVNAESGDFVLKRRDGLFAYQLAVVVDDAEQGVTDVVRGADLLSSTPRQLLIQQALGFATPKYAHVPLATDHRSVKLSKSAGAGAVDGTQPAQELWRALHFLRQQPPGELRSSPLRPLWEWAVHHWTTSPLHGIREAEVDAELVNKTG
jgi:glutamyl-Q tRNA(Asp) synthetase